MNIWAYMLVLFTILVSFIVGVSLQQRDDYNMFVKTKCAQYNPITGAFEILKQSK